MKLSSPAKYAAGVALAAALAACSSGGNSGFAPAGASPSGLEPGMTPLSVQRALALTMPHYKAGYVRPDRGKSWSVLPDKKKGKPLLYIDDDKANDVYVFSGFPNKLKLVQTLTGFDAPYGMCVDKKGDVYVTNFDNGVLDEYAYGGTKPINTYTDSGGYLIGCSVDSSGDVSATAFETSSGYGNVCIWKGGKGTPTCVDGSSSGNCYYLWTFGWDNKGNLIGEGEYSGISACAVLAGKTSMTKLTTSGITIDFPAGTGWDGKYIAVGDQEAAGTYKTGVWEATLSGSTLTGVGTEIVFTDTCYSDYVDDPNPFFAGGKANIVNSSTKEADEMIGPNLWCADGGTGAVDVWKYPLGGNPIYIITEDLTEPYGVALDWK